MLLLSSSLLGSDSEPESDVEVNDDDVDEFSTSAKLPSSLVSSARNGGGGGGGGGRVLQEIDCLPSGRVENLYSEIHGIQSKDYNYRLCSTPRGGGGSALRVAIPSGCLVR